MMIQNCHDDSKLSSSQKDEWGHEETSLHSVAFVLSIFGGKKEGKRKGTSHK